MGSTTYSPIPKKDIEILEANGCWAEDWGTISVAEGFNPKKMRGVALKGTVKIGRLDKSLAARDGTSRDAGIWFASLCDVTLGDNCAIKNVAGWLSNLEIGDEVIIENVGSICCQGETSFGNGKTIEVLNEGGGRELPVTARTSAQIAYLHVLYRDRQALVDGLDKIAAAYASSVKKNRAPIGNGAQIYNCREIVNVAIGEAALINGAQSLTEGTVDSSVEAPSVVGNAVIAEKFIFQKGSSVKDAAIITGALVGEGSKIGRNFSAENSVFFANSEGFHSEAVSFFGGPYSVTHHRSTLLIAALTSFYNAGSGTNQSNHMYKLGPLHQGIMERGSKTGSFSYLLWPARIGPFSAVLGKHYTNFDAGVFPFSYINEEHGKSVIVPGMNFFTVGTLRDGEKWPSRDRRKNSDKLDLLNFDVLSPFVSAKMIQAQSILMDLYNNSPKGQEYVVYKGINIKRLLLKTCTRYYRMALEKYFGDVLAKRVAARKPANLKQLFSVDKDGAPGDGEWVDLAGLLCPAERVEKLCANISSGAIADFDALQNALQMIFASYDADEWNWFMANFEKVYGVRPQDESAEGLAEFVAAWKNASQKLINMVLNDAQKEFEGDVRIGFGIDGNADADFDAVRGTFEGNKFVKKLKGDIEEISRKHEMMSGLIKN